jgi:dCMP deaminase
MKNIDTRPGWDNYFMDIAFMVSSRSTCLRRKVGAVIVKDKRILATGYNGAPSGIVHCSQSGCLREQMKIPSGQRHELCRGLHAEMNAIIQASMHGVPIQGSVLYSTNHPCVICAKMLINAGIRELIILGDYPDELSRSFLKEAGVRIRKIDGNERRCA